MQMCIERRPEKLAPHSISERLEWQASLVPDILSAVPLKDQSATELKVTGWSERVQN